MVAVTENDIEYQPSGAEDESLTTVSLNDRIISIIHKARHFAEGGRSSISRGRVQ